MHDHAGMSEGVMWKGQQTGSYPAPAAAVFPLQPLTKEISISWPSERRCYSVNKRCMRQHRDCHTLRSTNQQLSFIFLEGATPPPPPPPPPAVRTRTSFIWAAAARGVRVIAARRCCAGMQQPRLCSSRWRI